MRAGGRDDVDVRLLGFGARDDDERRWGGRSERVCDWIEHGEGRGANREGASTIGG